MKMNSSILIALPKHYLPASAISSDEMSPSENSSNSTRKRRLDHLSWEEKLQRKKLKNRVAAQTSRDRKKAKLDNMEDRLTNLEKINRKLLNEMSSLKDLNERLLSENSELRKQLASAPEVSRADSNGSAVSHPLPKEGSARLATHADQIAYLCRLAMLCLLSNISSPKLIPMNISIALNNSPTVFSEKLIRKLKTVIELNRNSNMKTDCVNRKWWGPHQSTWNPMELKT